MMNAVIDKYRSLIKEKLCVHCMDASALGTCRIGGGRDCPSNLYIDKIIKAVSLVKSDNYEDYVTSLRKEVCQSCTYGNAEDCAVRDAIECPLDRYYPLVVDAIEEAGFDTLINAYIGSRSSDTPPANA